MIHVTRHARMRVRQRLGRPARAVQRAAREAWLHGITIDQTAGNLRVFLDEKIERHGKGHDMRIFRGCVYVFEQEALITVYHVPAKLQLAARKQERRARE